MKFAFTEEQEALRSAARSFLADHSSGAQVRATMATDAGYDPALWLRLGTELGWTALLIPEAYDGLGLGYVELIALMEEMGAALLCAPFFSTVCLATNALLLGASEEQKRQYLPGIAAGEITATLVFTEPNGRWDAGGIEMVADPQGDSFMLNGRKSFVIDGHTADLLMVAARRAGSHGSEGIHLFIVAANTPGIERQALPTIVEALKQVHFPDDPMALFRARRRLAFDELLTLQLATAQRRARWAAEASAVALAVDDERLLRWTSELPFTLTGAQRRSLDRIREDLHRRVPMSRLLEGDVGSGKTVVAALAMRIAVECGAQAALMAPTELLADQHFETLRALYELGGPRIEKLTSSITGERRRLILEGLAGGEIGVVVGTHALVQEGVAFRKLALAVIDEQHRFGVQQRSTLREKGVYPHVLLTTATPIPQTLWQTLNRDLDVSILDEMPAGRQEIKTEVRTPDALPRIWPWAKTRVERGEQVFVVCPRIDEKEPDAGRGGELFDDREPPWSPSAVVTEEELRSGPLASVRVALVHGRMQQRERDAIMTRFRDREVDVLVATTVIEVGIDIPNATVMVVLGAERFGLAQLHQLRGRVGRGTMQSFCVLVSPMKDSDRLAAMTERIAGSPGEGSADGRERPLNGFELAKRDLQIRGPGQFLGQEQSGFADQLRVVDLMDIDPRLLDDASAEADRIIAADPELERAEHGGLREAVDELWRRYAYA